MHLKKGAIMKTLRTISKVALIGVTLVPLPAART
jgi:hypothetical protein